MFPPQTNYSIYKEMLNNMNKPVARPPTEVIDLSTPSTQTASNLSHSVPPSDHAYEILPSQTVTVPSPSEDQYEVPESVLFGRRSMFPRQVAPIAPKSKWPFGDAVAMIDFVDRSGLPLVDRCWSGSEVIHFIKTGEIPQWSKIPVPLPNIK